MQKLNWAQPPAIRFLAALTVALGLLAPPAANALDRGDQAPGIQLPTDKGVLALDQFRGKVVYIDFWASWCGPCRQSFRWMNDMQSRYGGNGLRIVGINVDQKPGDAKAFLKDNPAGFEVAFDQAGKIPRAYGVKGMPTSVLIGPDGKVLLVHMGFKDEHRGELEHQIKLALSLKE